METQKQITFQVPEINMSWLKGRVEELNKKAHKLGTPAVVFSVLRTYVKRTKDSEGREYDKMMNEIAISGIAPKLAGWSFLGTIQHTENGNIIRVINETAIPEEYRATKRVCGHCNKDRNRKDTYLVTHEDGTFKQVGKSCLKDYTGHISPAHLAMLAEFIDQLNKGEDSDYEENSRFPMEVPSNTFLRMACEAVVREGAYVTRKQTEITHGTATSDLAWMSLFPPKGTKFIPLTNTPAGEKLFNDVVNSLLELDSNNKKTDFEHNVLMAWKKGIIERREAGILGAAVLIHEKALLKKIDLKKNADSNWVGTVKERTNFNVVVTKRLGFETSFGYMVMILMKDQAGNILVWKTGTGFNESVSVGDELTIKATVKKHDEYQGVKQTILTRCTVLEKKLQNNIAV